MKKAIFIFIASLFCFQLTSVAQKARVGITGGISFANLSRSINGVGKDGEYRIGIAGGMLVDAPMGKKQKYSFQPALNYVQKGAAEDAVAPVNKAYTALRYAELSANFVRNLKWGKGNLYFGAGPYAGFNLPSKKVQHIPGNNIETDVSWGDQVANDLKGFDWGGNFVLGYTLRNGIMISLNYTQGARNLVPVDNGSDKIKNIAFGVKVGYLFKAKPAEKK